MKSISGRNPDEYLADSGRNARRGFGLHSLRSVGAKIYAIIALCFLTFVGVDAYQMWSAKLGLESQRRTEIKHLTEVARAAVQEEYAASQAGSISVEEARERAAARIAGLRYGEDGYFWIADHSKLVMLPPRPDLNGRDLGAIKDPHGKEILVEANKVASRDGQGYIDYEWPRPGQSRPVPKITYVVAFEPWGWAIGSGAYIDDIHAQIWAQVKQDLTILLLGLIACGAIQQLDQVIQQNAGASEELSATSEELASQAEQLQESISFFRIGDGQRRLAGAGTAAAAAAAAKLHAGHMQAGKPAKPAKRAPAPAQAKQPLYKERNPGASAAANGSGNGNGIALNLDGHDAHDTEFERY